MREREKDHTTIVIIGEMDAYQEERSIDKRSYLSPLSLPLASLILEDEIEEGANRE